MKIEDHSLSTAILQPAPANELVAKEDFNSAGLPQKFPDELIAQLNALGAGLESFGQAGLDELKSANASGRYASFQTMRGLGKNAQKGYEFAEFTVGVRQAIALLDSKATGETLLQELDTAVPPDANLRIRLGKANGAEYRHPDGRDHSGSTCYRNKENEVKGAGLVGTDVIWNPESHQVAGESRPSFIGLGHELVHAHRAYAGNAVHRGVTARELFVAPPGKFLQLNKERNDGITKDEAETVGIIDLSAGEAVFIPTENKLREEHGVKPRITYGDFVKK